MPAGDKRRWLRAASAAACGVLFAQALASVEDLQVRWSGSEVRVAAPRMRWLSGRPLERVRNGAAAPFDFQLSAWQDDRSTLIGRAFERYIISYDLWEERFAVTQTRLARRRVTNLTLAAAEAWCVDQITLPLADGSRRVVLRLEVRAAEPSEFDADAGISLATLIDLFSRPSRPQQTRFHVESGLVRLSEFRTK
jgi:hypothetical protein